MRPQNMIVGPGAVPSSPPAPLAAELRIAAEAMDRLRARGQTLHFEADPGLRRVRIELRDLAGNVLRTIPPSEAIAVAGGRMAE